MVFGLLNLNKPAGWTSRDVVNRVGRLVGKRMKAGHAGTLDPLATGVLVVCVGPATRLVPLIHDHSKSYEATFALGRRSDTDDIEGTVETVPLSASLTKEEVLRCLQEFTGEIEQVPPAYSAVKVRGERAYKAARRGENVQLAARPVMVHRLDLTAFSLSEFSLSIECGTGTYIRSIGRDLARRLGTEAVMSKLVRTRVGAFELRDAVDVEMLDRDLLVSSLISPLAMLGHLSQIRISVDSGRRLSQGRSLSWSEDFGPRPSSPTEIAVTDDSGRLLAIAAEKQGRLAPQIVFPMEE